MSRTNPPGSNDSLGDEEFLNRYIAQSGIRDPEHAVLRRSLLPFPEGLWESSLAAVQAAETAAPRSLFAPHPPLPLAASLVVRVPANPTRQALAAPLTLVSNAPLLCDVGAGLSYVEVFCSDVDAPGGIVEIQIGPPDGPPLFTGRKPLEMNAALREGSALWQQAEMLLPDETPRDTWEVRALLLAAPEADDAP